MESRVTPKRNTDKEFVAVIISNQLNFVESGCQLQIFNFPDPDNFPGDCNFTSNLQKYINCVVMERIEVYCKALKDIVPLDVDKQYLSLLESASEEFSDEPYSHHSFLVFCSDACCYTRCALLKGLASSGSLLHQYIAVVLGILRYKNEFSDWSFIDMCKWLEKEVNKIELSKGVIDIKPIEFSKGVIDIKAIEFSLDCIKI